MYIVNKPICNYPSANIMLVIVSLTKSQRVTKVYIRQLVTALLY